MTQHPRLPAGGTRVPSANVPVWNARDLTAAGQSATIVLDDQTYILRITRAGKLILTK